MKKKSTRRNPTMFSGVYDKSQLLKDTKKEAKFYEGALSSLMKTAKLSDKDVEKIVHSDRHFKPVKNRLDKALKTEDEYEIAVAKSDYYRVVTTILKFNLSI